MNKNRFASLAAAALAVMTIVSAGASVRAEDPAKAAAKKPEAAVSTIASCSKTYVTAAVMQLADQGKVDIDKPITAYLPEFRMKDPRYEKITARMLMNHRSGIMGTTNNSFLLVNDRDPRSHDTLLRCMQTQRLKTDPDDFGAYCNDGFTLLELIVEEVSGESFSDYIQHHICKPLGLKSTGTVWDMFQDKRQVMTFCGDARFAPDYCMAVGSGGIIASAEDMCSFGSAFFRGDTRLLSERAKDEMFTTSVTDKYEDGFGLGFDTVDSDDYKAAGVKVVAKGGDVVEQHASLVIAPEQKISVAVLSAGGSSLTDQLMATALMDIALEEQGIHVEHPEAVPKETLGKVPEKFLSYADVYLGSQSMAVVSFPDQKYMEITTISEKKRETSWYLCTTEDSFVKMDGDPQNGRAVQAKEQEVLHFVRRRGTDYIVSDQYNEVGLKGRIHHSSYLFQRLAKRSVSDDVQAAWDARSGKKYYYISGKYSDIGYIEMAYSQSKTYPEAPGYANFGRITDAQHIEAALVMPGGRDLHDITMRQENGVEYLDMTNQECTYISEDAIPELGSRLTEIPLHTRHAAWYRIGDEDTRTITLDIPEHASVYVYDAYDRMTYSSYMTDHGNTVPLPAGGKIVFVGEDGGSIRITQ